MPIIHYVIYSNIILVLFFVTCFCFENNFHLVLTLIAERYETYLSLSGYNAIKFSMQCKKNKKQTKKNNNHTFPSILCN